MVLATVGVLALAGSVGAWWVYGDLRRAEAQAAFDRNADLIHAAVDGRLAVYTTLLTGAAAYWRDHRDAMPDDWTAYVDALDIAAHYPGVDALTFTAYVEDRSKAAFLARMGDRHGPGFAIRPEGRRPDYFVIADIAPFGRALGLDSGAEPRRREAAERARDSGVITMTAPVALEGRDAIEQDFLLFAPIYSGLPAIPTVEQRRKALIGWSSMGVHGSALLGAAMSGLGDLGLRVVVESTGPEGPRELYRYPRGDEDGDILPFRTRRTIVFGGQAWDLTFRGGPALDAREVAKEGMVLVLGLGLAVAISLTVGLLMVSRQQAALLARDALDDLGRAERRLGMIVAASPAVIYSCEPHGLAATYVSDAIRSFGYEPAAVLGDPGWLTSRLHPDDAPTALARLDDLLSGAGGELVYRLRIGSGGWRWVLDRFTVVRGDDGAAIEVVGSLTDVTAQREAEAAMALNEHKYRSIVQATAEGYWLIDPVTHATLEVNGSLCRMLGYAADEMIGRPPTDFVDARNRRIFERQMRRIPNSDHRAYEITLKRKDGRDVIAAVNATSLRGPDGRLAAAFAFVSDVTAQRMHDREIARLQDRLRQILETAGEGICGFDAMGHLVFANHALGTLSGWTETELLGMGCDALFRSGEPASCPVAEARRGDAVRAQGVLQQRDGTGLPVELIATPLRDGGRVTGTVVVLRDVTERLAAQEVLQQREELFRDLQRSNAELEAFAFAASHDLRQPLRMVTSFLTLLERRLGAGLSPDCAEYLNFARDGAQRMDQLILALLEYSRVGRADAEFAAVDLGEVIEVALANLATAVEDAGASVTVEVASPPVWGDRIELVRLIQNLVGNAIKYRAADRPLAITICSRLDADGVVVAVRDNGIGIAPEYHERIFRIFQRLHTQEEVEGTGIGLALCRKIADHHGGRIWVESAADEGTTFLVALREAASSEVPAA